MEYLVLIKETLSKEVSVEAETSEDAIDIVENQYNSGEYILDADDFGGVEFEVVDTCGVKVLGMD